jgi:hypothetical protein
MQTSLTRKQKKAAITSYPATAAFGSLASTSDW